MGTMGKGLIGTVFKKSRAKKATILDTGFKVRDIDAEDGKMKMKKVSGLRRSAIVFLIYGFVFLNLAT